MMTGSGTGQLSGGTYNVVANYPGDRNLQASSSTATALSVQDFTLTPTSLSITVSAPGQTGSGTINFSLAGGLSQAPSFSCSGLPSESTCTFTAASAKSETVTIGTTAATWLRGDPLGRSRGLYYALVLPGLMGFVWPAGQRKSARRAARILVIVLAAFTLWMPACGNNSTSPPHNPGTPVGPATVTVTATESNVSHTMTINLNVQ